LFCAVLFSVLDPFFFIVPERRWSGPPVVFHFHSSKVFGLVCTVRVLLLARFCPLASLYSGFNFLMKLMFFFLRFPLQSTCTRQICPARFSRSQFGLLLMRQGAWSALCFSSLDPAAAKISFCREKSCFVSTQRRFRAQDFHRPLGDSQRLLLLYKVRKPGSRSDSDA
jgi:hypothetical protein